MKPAQPCEHPGCADDASVVCEDRNHDRAAYCRDHAIAFQRVVVGARVVEFVDLP